MPVPHADVLDSGAGLEAALDRVNALRHTGDLSPQWSLAEELLDLLFRSSQHLAAYGTLVPGAPNEHVLAPLTGIWRDGSVRGELQSEGWGMTQGFPAIRWDPHSDDEVPVKLFVSDDLPGHWSHLDHFEGRDYQRILVPVHDGRLVIAVANIYAVRR